MFTAVISIRWEHLLKKIKNNNLKNKILKQLFFNQSLSCLDLSEQVNKSIPFVTKVINEMIEENIVIEDGYAPSSGGRRPLMYSLKPNEMFIVSVAMDQLTTRITIIDSLNNYVKPLETYELLLKDNDNAIPQLIEYIKDYIQRSGIPEKKLLE